MGARPSQKIAWLDDLFARRVEGCWRWWPVVTNTGYVQIQNKGRMWQLHRFSYERFVGPIPEDYDLHHECETKNCANPAHLKPITRAEHALLGNCLGATNLRKESCPKCGGPFSPMKRGGRYCRPCHARLLHAWDVRNREKRRDIGRRYALRNK